MQYDLSPEAAACLCFFDPFEAERIWKGFRIMSDFTANHGALSATPSLARAARRTWSAITSPVRGYLQRQAIYRELSDLDDRMLADIGLNRSEVYAVASGIRRPQGMVPRSKSGGLFDIV